MRKKRTANINQREKERTKFIQLRVTPTEYVSYAELAKSLDMSMSEMIRVSLDSTQAKRIIPKDILIEKNRQLHYLSNNINQLAKWANTYKSGAESLTIIRRLKELIDTVKQWQL